MHTCLIGSVSLENSNTLIYCLIFAHNSLLKAGNIKNTEIIKINEDHKNDNFTNMFKDDLK